MRRSAGQTAKEYAAATVVLAALACVGAVFLFTLLFSALSAAADVSDGALSVMSGISLSAGCFAASFTAAKRRGRKGLATGFLCGAVVFGVIMLSGGIFVRSFSAGGIVSKLLIIMSCSGIGGIIGVNSRGKFR